MGLWSLLELCDQVLLNMLWRMFTKGTTASFERFGGLGALEGKFGVALIQLLEVSVVVFRQQSGIRVNMHHLPSLSGTQFVRTNAPHLLQLQRWTKQLHLRCNFNHEGLQ